MEAVERIARLERQVRSLTAALLAGAVAMVVVTWRAKPDVPAVLRVRQITVVDEKGTERMWIGAPVPDPIMHGKQLKRASAASGVILLDGHGDERGGFLTSPPVPIIRETPSRPRLV